MAHKEVTLSRMDGTQPTHINIHIHQESGMEPLFKACGALKKLITRRPGGSVTRAGVSYGLLALGVTQILLGVVSCVLGGFLYLGPWILLLSSGCGFWAGAVAIAAGTGAIIQEKQRGKVSGSVSAVLTLAATATALAAIVFCVNSFTWQDNGMLDPTYVCAPWQPDTTTTPYYGRRRWDSYYDDSWRERECIAFVSTVTKLLLAVRALLLTVNVVLAVVSLASLGVGLRLLCSRSSALTLDEEDSQKKLLAENSAPPSPYKEKNLTAINL